MFKRDGAGDEESERLDDIRSEIRLLVSRRSEPNDKYDGDIDVDLVLSSVHPLTHHASLLKRHRGCAYTLSKVYPIINVGQTVCSWVDWRRRNWLM